MNIQQKFRSHINYLMYVFSVQGRDSISIVINLGIFIFSIILFMSEDSGFSSLYDINMSIVFIFVFSLFNIIWSVYERTVEIKNYLGISDNIFLENDMQFLEELKNIVPSRKEAINYFEKSIVNNEPIFMSRHLNKYLWDNKLNLIMSSNAEKSIKRLITKNKSHLIPVLGYQLRYSLANKKVFINEKKLCLSSDIDFKKQEVVCHKGGYFDSFLTNEISTKLLQDHEEYILFKGRELFPINLKDRNNLTLYEITKARMNNHIGISTIGFTNDNYLIIWKQNQRTQINSDLFVPTGSGSCDLKDLQSNDFNQVIINAMQRELWEESGKDLLSKSYKDVGTTKILGFFRWIRRGGKPEFVGITKLNISSHDMKPNCNEVVDTTFNRSEENEFYIANINEIPSVIDDIKRNKRLSIPLLICLDALYHYYCERKDELEEFLF
ncbi:hypothetical protein CACET_c15880 [Clostridium aceticum]|uniref:Uncharacterized protein n=1 Tax=Clostridium aceticum TaxID=84022 RepID=A0A0D8ICW8_9CLOT|nr:hypothetical protein [Clostridium aceticum]AKL95037.1 hypothetical protein CACET_c15880 [Clostridium aceticum]KJF27929.1 hypothetical protein TZ02_04990 [Clostridium aceticum]